MSDTIIAPVRAPVATSTAGSPVNPGGAPISRGVRPLPLALTLAVGAAIWLAPFPAGVEPRAWHLLAIFAATIVGIVAQPLPVSAVALLGITAAVFTGTLSMREALSGFGKP